MLKMEAPASGSLHSGPIAGSFPSGMAPTMNGFSYPPPHFPPSQPNSFYPPPTQSSRPMAQSSYSASPHFAQSLSHPQSTAMGIQSQASQPQMPATVNGDSDDEALRLDGMMVNRNFVQGPSSLVQDSPSFAMGELPNSSSTAISNSFQVGHPSEMGYPGPYQTTPLFREHQAYHHPSPPRSAGSLDGTRPHQPSILPPPTSSLSNRSISSAGTSTRPSQQPQSQPPPGVFPPPVRKHSVHDPSQVTLARIPSQQRLSPVARQSQQGQPQLPSSSSQQSYEFGNYPTPASSTLSSGFLIRGPGEGGDSIRSSGMGGNSGDSNNSAHSMPTPISPPLSQEFSQLPLPPSQSQSQLQPYSYSYQHPLGPPNATPPTFVHEQFTHRQRDDGGSVIALLESNERRQTSRRYRKKTPPECCHVCAVLDTPEWRKGPAGPRTTCNACGLVNSKMNLPEPETLEEVIDQLEQIGCARFRTEGHTLPVGARERAEKVWVPGIGATLVSHRSRKNRDSSDEGSTDGERDLYSGLGRGEERSSEGSSAGGSGPAEEWKGKGSKSRRHGNYGAGSGLGRGRGRPKGSGSGKGRHASGSATNLSGGEHGHQQHSPTTTATSSSPSSSSSSAVMHPGGGQFPQQLNAVSTFPAHHSQMTTSHHPQQLHRPPPPQEPSHGRVSSQGSASSGLTHSSRARQPYPPPNHHPQYRQPLSATSSASSISTNLSTSSTETNVSTTSNERGGYAYPEMYGESQQAMAHQFASMRPPGSAAGGGPAPSWDQYPHHPHQQQTHDPYGQALGQQGQIRQFPPTPLSAPPMGLPSMGPPPQLERRPSVMDGVGMGLDGSGFGYLEQQR